MGQGTRGLLQTRRAEADMIQSRLLESNEPAEEVEQLRAAAMTDLQHQGSFEVAVMLKEESGTEKLSIDRGPKAKARAQSSDSSSSSSSPSDTSDDRPSSHAEGSRSRSGKRKPPEQPKHEAKENDSDKGRDGKKGKAKRQKQVKVKKKENKKEKHRDKCRREKIDKNIIEDKEAERSKDNAEEDNIKETDAHKEEHFKKEESQRQLAVAGLEFAVAAQSDALESSHRERDVDMQRTEIDAAARMKILELEAEVKRERGEKARLGALCAEHQKEMEHLQEEAAFAWQKVYDLWATADGRGES